MLHTTEETDEAVINAPVQSFLLVYFLVPKAIELGCFKKKKQNIQAASQIETWAKHHEASISIKLYLWSLLLFS